MTATMPARIILSEAAPAADGAVERQLGTAEILWNSGFVRKTVIIVVLALVWEAYARFLDNPLLFPTFSDTVTTLWQQTLDGTIPNRALTSIKVLLMGYVAGILLAATLTMLAISTRIGTDFLETMTAMFNPLPAIALLPLALIWFGLATAAWSSCWSIRCCGRWRSTPIRAFAASRTRCGWSGAITASRGSPTSPRS